MILNREAKTTTRRDAADSTTEEAVELGKEVARLMEENRKPTGENKKLRRKIKGLK
ncbi:MAG: hypothetical protein M1839_005678 [Geoglossum umbratile]|nr:MAG: hypothetical protein M1839_005678 [Geoglossum umbratile]